MRSSLYYQYTVPLFQVLFLSSTKHSSSIVSSFPLLPKKPSTFAVRTYLSPTKLSFLSTIAGTTTTPAATTTTSTRAMTTRLFAKAAKLSFGSTLDKVFTDPDDDDDTKVEYNATVIIGRKDDLEQLLPSSKSSLLETLGLNDETILNPAIVSTMIKSVTPKGGGSSSTLLALPKEDGDDGGDDVSTHKFVVCGLPTKNISRNNHPMSVHKLTTQLTNACPATGTTRVVVLVRNNDNDDGDDGITCSIGPLSSAIAKAFPLFTLKTTGKKKSKEDNDNADSAKEGNDDDDDEEEKLRKVHVVFVQAPAISTDDTDEAKKEEIVVVNDPIQLNAANAVATGVQLSGRLVDSHPELLTTTQFSKEVETVVTEWNSNNAKEKHITMNEIVGDDLKEYGGLYGVGKAATCPPRMIILEYNGSSSSSNDDDEEVETIALVGKGIVYDTGGLSLKTKTGMCSMKTDMGGAAGVFGGFISAVKCNVQKKVICILCIAENAIGPTAFRNDDILQMYSGKTVEVNNCDAEGRLVLADGVAHVTKHYPKTNIILDMATLTGAQMITTGKKHAGILCNSLQLEQRIYNCGLNSGDLCFPMLYAPELLLDEFKSEVADMKNSVKDRGNAQASCAGHFIEAHLDEDYNGGWIHVDMAGPSTSGARGTGYGVGLVLKLLNAPGF